MAKRGRPHLVESPTRRFILKAATIMFRQRGFKQVSIEDICSKAGASKMSFYRHFRDKVHIALIVLDHFVAEELLWAEELLKSQESFVAKMNQFLMRRQKNQTKLGKLFLSEFNQSENPEAKIFGEKWVKEIDTLNLKFLAEGQKQEVISEKIKPDIFLFFIKKRNELLLDKELIKLCPDVDERFNVVNNFFYFGMRNRPEL